MFAKEDGSLVAYVSAHKLNLRNWWSGKWSGRLVMGFTFFLVSISAVYFCDLSLSLALLCVFVQTIV